MSHFADDAPFDERATEAVAGDYDVGADRLRELVVAHQRVVADDPGVENLVYEWRKQFGATVRRRSDAWYVVDVPEWTWEEFVPYLDADEEEGRALMALHERVATGEWTATADSVDEASGAGTTPMVLRRG